MYDVLWINYSFSIVCKRIFKKHSENQAQEREKIGKDLIDLGQFRSLFGHLAFVCAFTSGYSTVFCDAELFKISKWIHTFSGKKKAKCKVTIVSRL